jgi:hypothetical protein
MVVTIFGATGMVGSQLVKQALAKGFVVKAFSRNINDWIDADLYEDKFDAIKGYVLDEDDVLNAIKGSDAVLSALGGGIDGTDNTRSLGMKNIIKQMQQAGVNRIIAVGGLGSLNSSVEGKLIMELPTFPAQYLPVAKEHHTAYTYLKASNLNWTFVCSPDIKNKDEDGNFITSANFPPAANQHHISAGNLAAFMLSEITGNQYICQKVGISDASNN